MAQERIGIDSLVTYLSDRLPLWWSFRTGRCFTRSVDPNRRPVEESAARKVRPRTVRFAQTAQQNVPGRIPACPRLSPGHQLGRLRRPRRRTRAGLRWL